MLLIPAHAKLNLCLAVRGRRADGYHEIDSVAVRLDWHDLVGVVLRPASTTAVHLRVSGGLAAGVPGGEQNLAVKAARGVAAVAGPFEATLWLDKCVPSAAGLGGGSGDAAAVLAGCWSLISGGVLGPASAGSLARASREELAASLGSDVPMQLAGGGRRMRGRGEVLEPLPAVQLHLAVVIAGSSATAATFAEVRDAEFENGARCDAVARALAAGVGPLDDALGSGLEAAACRAHPALAESLGALRAAMPEVRWHLTGSGGAVFAIARDAAHADGLALRARGCGFSSRPCRTVSW